MFACCPRCGRRVQACLSVRRSSSQSVILSPMRKSTRMIDQSGTTNYVVLVVWGGRMVDRGRDYRPSFADELNNYRNG